MESVYIETSIISYLAARMSRDMIVAGHQQLTEAWWQDHRKNFDLYSSDVVIAEAEKGDPFLASSRIGLLEGIPLLDLTAKTIEVGQSLMHEKILPPHAELDAYHIALAAVYEIDYLLTWNCKHIANRQTLKKVRTCFEKQGLHFPIVATPEELMGEDDVERPDY